MADAKLSSFPTLSAPTAQTDFVVLQGATGSKTNRNLPKAALDAYIKSVVPFGSTDRHVGIAAVGDSLTEMGRVGKNGWLRKMCYFTHQSLRFRGETAVGGATMEQIETNQIPMILAMEPKPKACIVAGGSNNYLNDAVVDTGIAALVRICTTLLSNGIMPVLWTLPPRGDISGSEAGICRWNYKVHMLRSQMGLPLADAAGCFQADAGWAISPSAATWDGTHFTVLGAAILGKFLSTSPLLMDGLPKDGPLGLSNYNYDTYNLQENGLFVNESSTPGLGSGVNLAENSTAAWITQAGVKGRMQQILRSESAPSSLGSEIGNIQNLVPGDILEFAIPVKSSSPGSPPGGAWNTMLAVYYTNSSWGAVTTQFLLQSNALDEEFGTVLVRDTVPAGAAHLQILLGGSDVEITSPISVAIGQVTVRKVISV